MAGPIDWDFTIGPIFGIIAVVALVALIFDIWMLVDAISRRPEDYPSPDHKTLWVVGLIVGLVTGLPALAVAIAYYIIVRQPAKRAGAARPAPPVPSPGAPPPGPESPSAPPPTGAIATPPPPAAPSATYCSNCGTKLNAGARFCHSCGTPV